MVLQVMKKALASTPGIILFLESWPKGWRETGLMPQKVLADLLSWGFVLKRMEGKTGRMESIEYPERFMRSLKFGLRGSIVDHREDLPAAGKIA
jgi:hypothetical protein